MALICPRCSQKNYDEAAFCSRCSFKFLFAEDAIPLNNAVPTPTPAKASNAAYADYAARANPPQLDTPQPYRPPQSSPVVGPTASTPQTTLAEGSALYALQPGGSAYKQPGAPDYGSPTNDPYGAPGSAYQQQQQQIPFPNRSYMSSPQGQPYPDPGIQPPQGKAYPDPGIQPPQGKAYPDPGMQPSQGQPSPDPGMQPPQGQPSPDPGMQPSQGKAYFAPFSQYNIRKSLSVVQRAFAGKGTPITHTSWLLDREKVSPTDVRSTIVEKILQRYSREVNVSQERLSERDTVLEERDYVRIERAPVNVFIYVTPFGNDLYISRTTTVQPALSLIRIVVLSALFLLMLIGFIASAAGATSALISLSSALLLIFFVALAIHSLVLWLTERDFLVYLRPNVLNDFRIDDGAILEHIADRSIRAAAEELKLDVSSLSAPTRNYPARQPLHLI